MQTKLPKNLRGPFVSGYYNRQKARLYLKSEGTYQIVDDVYPAMFVLSDFRHKLPKFIKDYSVNAIEEGKYTRILLDPKIRRTDIDAILNGCRDKDVHVYEADVDPIRRWFSDTGARVSGTSSAFFFDIETLPKGKAGFDDEAKSEHMVLSVAASDGTKMHFWYNHTCDEEGEAKVIKQFLNAAIKYDTLLAWNGDAYDFFVLKARCEKLDINVEWFKWNLLDYMLTVKKCLMSISEPMFKRSFSLDNVGQNVLGIKKIKIDCPMTNLDTLVLNGRVKELKTYNERDVEIMVELERKREFFKLHSAVCAICRKFPDKNSLFPNALMDGLMLRLAMEEDRHFRSRYSSSGIEEDDSKFPGAYVMDAELGFHSSVQVVDFASLYPSIMISWNISPDTKVNDYTPRKIIDKQSCYASASGIRFRTDREGMLPMALRKMIEQRKLYSKKQKEATVGSEEWSRFGHESTALKVVANSMYGLLGSQYSRYYDKDLAQSVTLTGQLLIKAVIAFVQDKGFRVIASDTDSNFIIASPEETKTLVQEINNTLVPKILNEAKCRTTAVKIDYDKGYKHLLIQAKKKYAGILSLYKGNPAPDDMEPDIKGLEFQRSDQIKFAQRMQMHFVKLLLNPDVHPVDVENELERWSVKFFTEEIDRGDIEITQAVSKHPDKYPSPTIAVRVASQMIQDGEEFYVGMKIPYIVVSHDKDKVKAIHADKYEGNFDRNYYWAKKIAPIVERIVRVRFQNYIFSKLDNLVKSPRQCAMTFEEPMRIRKPKLPNVSSVSTVKVKKPKRKAVTLIIEASDPPIIIKGISKLLKHTDGGKYKLRIKIVNVTTPNIKLCDVGISTNETIDQECIDNILKTFPSVRIEKPKA